jgi:protein gp37
LTGSRMFPFITKTWNPLGGQCLHQCYYCWAQGPDGLAQTRNMKKYRGLPSLIDKEFLRKFKPYNDFVFVCDMLDLFGTWVPNEYIIRVLDFCRKNSQVSFLLQTKNPDAYFHFYDNIPPNCYLGCTIESNRDYPELSGARPQTRRLEQMSKLSHTLAGEKHIFISIEPILDFDYEPFVSQLLKMRPWAVAIGYDNYDNKLPEPSLAKTMQLIDRLEKAGITVYRKTLREAWNERRG